MDTTAFRKIKEQLNKYLELLNNLNEAIIQEETIKIGELLNEIKIQFNEINQNKINDLKLKESEIEEIKEKEEIIAKEIAHIKEKLNNKLTIISNELNGLTITKSLLQNYYKYKNVSSRFIDQKL